MSVQEKILVIRHGAFGDLVQAAGALRDIRHHHSQAEIVLLTAPSFRKLMTRCPDIDRLLPDERAPFLDLRRFLALRRQLRAEGFSRIYDLQNSRRTSWYQRLIFAGLPWVGAVANRPAGISDREAYALQLAAAGVPAQHAASPDVSWMADDMGAYLGGAGVRPAYVVLIPGCAAKHQHKRWPYYADLARELIARGHEVVTVPGPDEIELCKTIPGKVLLHADQSFLNWFQLAGVIKGAAFVVGNDTGPSHVASCLGRPGLVLFGSHTSAAKTGILREDFCAIEVGDLKELPVAQVLEAVLSRLPVLQ